MTISTRTLGCLVTVTALGIFTPTTAWAAPEAPEADDVEADVEADADEVSEDDKDIDIEVEDDDDDKGCTIATGRGQNIGGLLCTLGLLGWAHRRRRAA